MSFPLMSEAFADWTVTSTFLAVVKEVIDFRVVETIGGVPYGGGGYGMGPYGGAVDLSGVFEGVLQPLPDRRLLIKPEGQRTWKWWTLWARKALVLDDVVVDKEGLSYRIMSVKDWSNSDYFEYDLTENVLPAL